MSKLTITEALAELKTLDKRIAKKREFIVANLFRQDRFKDPLEKDGGSRTVIGQERQAVADLEARMVAIRAAIATANTASSVTINGVTRSISDWLVWRRDVAPKSQAFLKQMSDSVRNVRREAMQKGLSLTTATEAARPDDVIVNFDEKALADEIENLEATLGALDGQLSLKNATVLVDA